MLVATRALARRAPASSLRVAHLSTASALEAESERFSIYNPTEEHVALRQMVRSFAEQEVDPQRAEYNEKEQFNRALFARCGELGLLGVTADESCGGSGMDAVAACVVHEELSAADPAFALSYLAHSMLYVNNVNLNASEDQKRRWLPGARDAVWNSNLQDDFNVSATVSTRALWPCFENSERAIDSSKNQPNRRRIDRARDL